MKSVAVVCCSVLRAEVQAILKQDYPEIKPVFLDSRLHMKPAALQHSLEQTITEQTLPTLVIYGECGTDMPKIDGAAGCLRTAAVNCSELIAGHEQYIALRNEQAFVFLNEWTRRWKEIFQQDLGFTDEKLARCFMQEYRKSLVYLDTGIVPVPQEILQEIESFFGMPVRVQFVGLEPLRAVIKESIARLQKDGTL